MWHSSILVHKILLTWFYEYMCPGAFGSIERSLLQSAAQHTSIVYSYIHTPVKSRWLRCSQCPHCCWPAPPPPWPGTSWTSTWRGRTWTRSCSTSPPSLPNHSSSEGSLWLSALYTFPICVYSDSGWHRHGQIKLILCGSRVMWLFSRGINIQHFDMDHPLNIYLMFKHWSDVAEENDSDVTEFLPNVKDLRNLVYNLIRLQVKLLQVYLHISIFM